MTDLKFYGDENLLKPKIREIYAKLKLNAKEEIGYIPEYTRDKKKNNVDRRTKKQIFKDNFYLFLVILIVIGFLAIFVIGFVTVFKWIF